MMQLFARVAEHNKTSDNAKDVETANTSGTPPESNEQDSQTQNASVDAGSGGRGMNDGDDLILVVDFLGV